MRFTLMIFIYPGFVMKSGNNLCFKPLATSFPLQGMIMPSQLAGAELSNNTMIDSRIPYLLSGMQATGEYS